MCPPWFPPPSLLPSPLSTHQITKHYSKKNVQAKDVLPLFPDFDVRRFTGAWLKIVRIPVLFFLVQFWKLPFAQVLFDSDPATIGKAETRTVDEMSQAMIRSAPPCAHTCTRSALRLQASADCGACRGCIAGG